MSDKRLVECSGPNSLTSWSELIKGDDDWATESGASGHKCK